jgi:chitinase
MKKILILIALVSLGCFQCLRPNYVVRDEPGKPGDTSAAAAESSADAIPYFTDGYSPEGGYAYAYPEKTSQVMPDEDVFKTGTDGLKISLDTKAWSGVGIGRSFVDLRPLRNKGSVVFYIKGETGKENGITFSLVDSPGDGSSFHTDLPLMKYCKISKDWQEVSIPLADFPDDAQFWSEADQAQKSGKVDWKEIAEVSMTTGPMAYGKNMVFYIDELRIVPETKTSRLGASSSQVTLSTAWTEPRTISGKRVMVYYPSWSAFYKADSLPMDKLTHIFHAFVVPSADGDLIGTSGFFEPDLIAAARAKNVKVIVSIGGANQIATANFKKIAASPELRQKFADNLEQICRKNGYDGVDLDWEFPESAEDTQNEVLLMKTVKEKFLASPAPAPHWTISKAAAAGNWFGRWSNYDELGKYMDFFNVMTYDFHGAWSGHSGHNAALLTGKDSEDPESSCEGALIYMTNTRKVPRSKINLGLAFYGQKFPNSKTLYDKCGGDSKTEQMNYDIIYPLLSDKTWTKKWDPDSLNPWLQSTTGQGIIVYDDERSLREKVKFVWQKNLAGVFVWDITADFVDGENKLMNAVYDEASRQVPAK